MSVHALLRKHPCLRYKVVARAAKALLSTVLIGVLTGSSVPHVTAASAPIKVLSYNIHHGEGTDGRFDLPGIAALIRAAGADIVGLQEVDQKTTRSMMIDQGAELARLLGYHMAYATHFPYKGGNYGVALLSRYPIVSHKAYPLPTAPGVEAKSMLQATVDVNGSLIDVFVVHLEVSNTTIRQAQAEAAAAIAARSPHPALLMGDFNALPESLVMVPFRYIMLDTYVSARFLSPASLMEKDDPMQRTYSGGGATWPANAPKNRADLIWASPHWRPVQGIPLRTIASVRSDHTAVLATLELAPAEQTAPGQSASSQQATSQTAPGQTATQYASMPPATPVVAENLSGNPLTWKKATSGAVFLPPSSRAWLERTGVNVAEFGSVIADWLQQAGLSAKVVDNAADIPPGGLVVLPGGRYIAAEDAAALKAHLAAGGALIAWGDAAMETPAGAAQPLAATFGISYIGWSAGFPTRGQLVVESSVATRTGLPVATKFWRMEGPVVKVLPGAQALGNWKDTRGEKSSHPLDADAALVQNGRAVYIGFDPLQLSDRDNPDIKALFSGIVGYLAAEKQ